MLRLLDAGVARTLALPPASPVTLGNRWLLQPLSPRPHSGDYDGPDLEG